VLRTDVRTVSNQTVTAGQPFYIPVVPLRCFPAPSFSWVVSRIIDKDESTGAHTVTTSRRIQISENGKYSVSLVSVSFLTTFKYVSRPIVSRYQWLRQEFFDRCAYSVIGVASHKCALGACRVSLTVHCPADAGPPNARLYAEC